MEIRYHHTEKKSGIPELLQTSIFGVSKYKNIKLVEDMKCEVDYVLSDFVGVERKEINDLVSSIQEGKIPSQLKRIIDMDLKPIFLVEGVLPNFAHTDMKLESIYGFISKMSENGITVEHTVDEVHSHIRLMNITLDVANGHFGVLHVPVIRTKADHPTLQRLMAIPGVGEEMAYKIRQHFKDELDFLGTCTAKDYQRLIEIDGIGKVLAKKIASEVAKTWN